MEEIIIDSNVIAKYLKSKEGILGDILEGYKLKIVSSTITELLASSKADNASSHKEILAFIASNFEVINIDAQIAQVAGDLVRQIDITLAQALVAATSLNTDIPLLTYEMSSFDVIPDLKLIDI